MAESSRKRSRTKTTANRARMESMVDSFFSEEQMAERFSRFVHRKLEKHKVIDLNWFLEKGFEFPRMLMNQHLELFCNLNVNIYPKLVCEFYANLVKRKEGWLTEVKGTRIPIKMSSIEEAGGLLNDGVSFFDLSQLEWEGFNYVSTFIKCVRPSKRYCGKHMQVGLMNVNDRMLHYMIVYILLPRLHNKAQPNAEDLKFIYALKKGVQVNWADVVWGHMLRRSKEPSGALPYPALISKLIISAGVNVTNEAKLSIRERADKIDSMTLNKMKIVEKDGAWHWLDDLNPGKNPAPSQAEEMEAEEEDDIADIPESSRTSNFSLEDMMLRMQGMFDAHQGYMQEQFSQLRNDMTQRMDQLEISLMESLQVRKESADEPPPPES